MALSNQQVETYIYQFRQQIEALQSQQTSQNAQLNSIQAAVNILVAAPPAVPNSSAQNTNVFTRAVTFLSDVVINGILTLTNALAISSGGTGATSASAARTSLSVAKSGANSDITSLTGLSTPLPLSEGGTGQTSAIILTFNTRSGSVTLTKADVDAVEQALGVGDSPTFNGLTLGTLSMLGLATLAGVKFGAGNTTGSGTALLGTNSPAVTNTAPYTWLTITSSDGSTCYIPCWK